MVLGPVLALPNAEPAVGATSRSARTRSAALPLATRGRSSRMVRLTDLGEAFLPRARSILLQTNDAAKEIRARTGLEKGVVRVGASGALAYHLLPLLIVESRALYPNIDLQIAEHRPCRAQN
jgi:DNA-binding transcriptional LysR family regulator